MDNFYDKIDQYLMDALSQQERDAFEVQLENDATLAAKVEEQRKAIHLLETVRNSKMKVNLQEIHQSVVKTEAKIIEQKRTWWKWSLSAAAAAIGFFFIFHFLSGPQPLPELYASYHQTYPISVGTRTNDTNPELVKAAQLYQQGNYATALTEFQKLEQLPDNSLPRLAMALAQMELNKPQVAIDLFTSLLNDPIYQEPAQWYRALCFLKLANVEACKNQLNDIQKNSTFYQQAQQLLNDL